MYLSHVVKEWTLFMVSREWVYDNGLETHSIRWHRKQQ